MQKSDLAWFTDASYMYAVKKSVDELKGFDMLESESPIVPITKSCIEQCRTIDQTASVVDRIARSAEDVYA